jgi:hypothetical protein
MERERGERDGWMDGFAVPSPSAHKFSYIYIYIYMLDLNV